MFAQFDVSFPDHNTPWQFLSYNFGRITRGPGPSCGLATAHHHHFFLFWTNFSTFSCFEHIIPLFLVLNKLFHFFLFWANYSTFSCFEQIIPLFLVLNKLFHFFLFWTNYAILCIMQCREKHWIICVTYILLKSRDLEISLYCSLVI